MVTPAKLNRRAAFFEQLAAMIAAGMPLINALEMAGRTRSIGVPRRVVQAITSHLKEGHTFTDAMQLASGQMRALPGMEVTLKPDKDYWLSDFDMALLSAGEQSGRLDSAFRLLARHYTSRAKIIRDTISSMIVTIVTVHVALLIFPLPLFVAFVLGIVNGQYQQCLPYIILETVLFGTLYGAVWFLGFAIQGNRGEGWRSVVEAIFGLIPWLSQAVKYLAVARLAMALEALLNAGVPVIRAWNLAAVSCGSPRLKSEIMKWTPQLEQGVTPAEMVAQIPYFPEMFTQLHHTGEISGRMDETLTRLHTYFEDEGFRKLQIFCRVLNYLIYFTIAIGIGIFVIHFWVNYYRNLVNSF